MPNELTNLLPLGRRQALVREYRFRLGVVVAALFSSLAVISATLLMPTYVFLVGSAHVKEVHLANIKSTLSSSDENALSVRLAALARDAGILVSLAKRPFVSKIIQNALSIPRPGITLSGFIYTPATGKNGTTLALSGIAATRDALRRYQLTLQESPTVESAALPVSAYAKDANIAFTITLTLAP